MRDQIKMEKYVEFVYRAMRERFWDLGMSVDVEDVEYYKSVSKVLWLGLRDLGLGGEGGGSSAS